MMSDAGPSDGRLTHDEIFAALPPLDSPAYLDRIRHAPKSVLPAQVLVRAFYTLSQAGPDGAAQATLSRLLGDRDGKPEYMYWLLREADKQLPSGQIGYDALDLYMEALDQIVKALERPSGKGAHTGWKAFCLHRLIDARRARFGTDGQRTEPEHLAPSHDDSTTGAPIDRLEHPVDGMDWHGTIAPDREEELDTYLRSHVEAITCERTRTVTLALYFGPTIAQVSGAVPSGSLPSLTERLGLSRDQINRAKTKGDAVIRAAMQRWQTK